MTTLTLTLASASPRRKELLASLHSNFTVLAVDIEEIPFLHETPLQYVNRLALEKASAGLARLTHGHANSWVLGADTIVVSDAAILEKPQDYADFSRMMTMLSGRSHKVITAVCLTNPNATFTECVVTKVNFRPLSESDIYGYWQTGEPKDKAGGYGIQGIAARFVQSISGSYSAVVGLPLCETEALLKRAGFACPMVLERAQNTLAERK